MINWTAIGEGALNQGASSLVGSIVDGITSLFGGKSSARKAYDNSVKLKQMDQAFYREMNKLGHQQQIELFNKQNLYNTPSAEMARLKAAGINPDLYYGNGGSSMSPMVSSSAGSSPSSGNQDSSYFAQERYLKAQTRLAEAQAALVSSEKKVTDEEGQIKETENHYADLIAGKSIRLMDSDIEFKLSQTNLTNAQKEKLKHDIDLVDRNIQRLDREIDFFDQTLIDRINYQTWHTQREFFAALLDEKSFQDRLDYISNQTALSRKEVDFYAKRVAAEIFNLIKSGELSGAETALKDIISEVSANESDVLDNTEIFGFTLREANAYIATFGNAIGLVGDLFGSIVRGISKSTKAFSSSSKDDANTESVNESYFYNEDGKLSGKTIRKTGKRSSKSNKGSISK